MIFVRRQSLIKETSQVFFWHVKRELNSLPDEMENKGVNGEFGSLSINGKASYSLIP
jgi:hypothetical protein